jgi:hypothetical protein
MKLLDGLHMSTYGTLHADNRWRWYPTRSGGGKLSPTRAHVEVTSGRVNNDCGSVATGPSTWGLLVSGTRRRTAAASSGALRRPSSRDRETGFEPATAGPSRGRGA